MQAIGSSRMPPDGVCCHTGTSHRHMMLIRNGIVWR